MVSQHQNGIVLVIANAQTLESGLSAQIRFVESGGTIGSSPSASWRLKDRLGRVHDLHCEILVVDGAFCVRDGCGQTFVNGADMPLGKGQLARLAHKDEMQIGPYEIRVLTGEDGEIDTGHIDTLFDGHHTDLLANGHEPVDHELELEDASAPIDPLVELEAKVEAQGTNWLLGNDLSENANDSGLISKKNLTGKGPSFTPQADSEDTMSASVRLKRIFGFGQRKQQNTSHKTHEKVLDAQSIETAAHHMPSTLTESETKPMDEKELGLLEQEVAKSLNNDPSPSNESAGHGKHLLTGPMLEGLGVRVSNEQDVQRMHFLSQEMGQSLQACLKGLLALHEQAAEGRFGTMNRNLQPIEDNPLRLGLSYEETVGTMYDADKSLVHLSAPAAIAESLKNVRDHNEATQDAISEALDQILNAFSPDVLLRRFQHCRRNTDAHEEGESAWAWEMYCNYYRELTSNRQQGFSKLFWEIFEQVYDKRIREKQLER
ncbi:type VI secretion system-associated FHA domain protein TagH [Salinivibrio sp. ES.052]|uniref:type VI secretion system-associated FHA domain protein TagH n=1 Tax=Salinivibrio sp. ES.052 TaxID=1882823 RepID=UPI00092A7214|nr:type VI secretion system-associated FHA domain protein TagH [Salinivibrio sp. ES.052]SIO32337.1 FHA domain protein [Salinivibrio sp. ES.052]